MEGGEEAIVHAINGLIDHLDTSSSEPVYVLKADDLKNAFNMVNRETFFEQVRLICPSISSYIEFCYTDPALLFLADYILFSFTGVQQGPLLFSLVLQKIINQIVEECNKNVLG